MPAEPGYRGRVAISELLIVNDNIRQMIVNRERSSVIQKEAVKNGMKTLWHDGLKKVEDGITSLSELERVTDDTSGKDDVKKITNKTQKKGELLSLSSN